MSVQASRTSSLLTVAGLAGLSLFSVLFSSRKKRSSDGWVDVTAGLHFAKTPIYEGDPSLRLEWTRSLAQHGVNLSRYSMGSHTGTHIDAPLHFVEGGRTIDQIGLDTLIGPARVIDIPAEIQAITAAVLKQYRWKDAKRILFRTKSSTRRWMQNPLFHKDYPFIAPDAARLLARRGVQLVGIDYLSVEKYNAPPETHILLLAKNVWIVEGLDLSEIEPGDYDVLLLPLKLVGGEAAPARALLRKRG
ncbi:MAG: cyclase family protein [Acidobacteriaceae bacterium]